MICILSDISNSVDNMHAVDLELRCIVACSEEDGGGDGN